MSLTAGARLGSYEILAPIGQGGMGEVYRARDTQLKRDVAIKVLPDAFAQDPERLGRFQREAELLATLNHPNIAAVYGVERSSGVNAIVLELVEGETLADRLQRGAIPIDEALTIARQIVEAMEAAHEKGIVHRDLKPANIKVTPDDRVKVLDFGLAKMSEAAGAGLQPGPDVTASPTLTTPAMTMAGLIMGTAAYMSPEQAKGRTADKRSDVWAFGCVLYEMLSGRRAFEGDDVSDTLAAVLRGDPDWNALPDATPASIRRLLRRALAKDRRTRLADVADARLDLDDAAAPALETENGRATRAQAPDWHTRIAWTLCGLALVVALALAYLLFTRSAAAARPIRFTIAPPDGWTVGFDVAGAGGAANLPLAVSPDGRQLVMVSQNAEGRARLWVRAFDTLAARELAGTDGAMAPFWSPDSRFVAFFADGRLKKVDIAGGLPTPLCSLSSLNSGAWGTQGVLLLARAGGGGGGGVLLRVPQSGGEPTPATSLGAGDGLHVRPVFLPDGRHFIYRATARGTDSGGIYVSSLDSSERQRLFADGIGQVVYARAHLLFIRESTLMAQPFDAQWLALTGEPVPIADQVQTNGNSAPVGDFSASDTGVVAYQISSSAEIGSQLTWFDRSGTTQGVVGTRGKYADVELSPDGTQASVSIAAPRGQRDIWLIDIARGVPTKFTFDDGGAQASIWAPDGKRVAFNASRAGRFDLFQKTSNGGDEEPLLTDMSDKVPLSWSPDGRFILYADSRRVTPAESPGLWILPLSGDRKPVRLLQTPSVANQGQFSPDGHWIAFTSYRSGRGETYVTPFPRSKSVEWQVSTSGGTEPRWRPDGKELFYLNGDALMAASVAVDTDGVRFGVPQRLFTFRTTGSPRSKYAVAPDGQRFLFNTRTEETRTAPITIVMNWGSE